MPGTGLGILRHARQGRDSVRKMSSQVARRAQDPAERLVLAKANSRSTVYRANYLDYVSVKKLGPDGPGGQHVTGEFRFLGLYTHAAHTAPIAGVPVLRRKLAQVLAAAGLSRDGHDGKDLVEILEDYPREELFEISAEELTPIALGVLRLSERKQTRLFLRRDRYGRYMSCLVYLPQGPVHHEGQAARAGHLAGGAARGLGGLQRHDRRLGPGPAVRGGPGTSRGGRCRRWTRPRSSASWPRRSGRGTRIWPPRRSACSARSGPATLLDLCGARIPETYKADVSAADAVDDLSTMLGLRESGSEFAVRLVEHPERWTLVVYRSGTPITLSDVLPQLQHMGLEVVDEHPYRVRRELDGRFVLDL